MARDRNSDLRNCGWCKREIGRGARVCPHCYRGQGIWILVTALPTWITGIAAVAAAAGAAYFVDLARNDLHDARTMLTETESRLGRAETLASSYAERLARVAESSPTGGARAEFIDMPTVEAPDGPEVLALQERDHAEVAEVMAEIEALTVRVSSNAADFSKLKESIAALATRMDAATGMAREAVAAARKADEATAGLEERVQKAADARALGSVEARLENIVEKYEDSETVCERAGTVSCRSSRDDAVTKFASLGHDLDAYRGNVTSVAHRIMTQNACNQGRRMMVWPSNEDGIRSDAWDDFETWYQANCG